MIMNLIYQAGVSQNFSYTQVLKWSWFIAVLFFAEPGSAQDKRANSKKWFEQGEDVRAIWRKICKRSAAIAGKIYSKEHPKN